MNDKLYEILVPSTINGKPILGKEHRVWDEKVRELTGGGLTVFPKTIIGYWECPDSGEVYKERTLPVRIKCTEEQINAIADFTAKYYNQKAVMFYVVSSEVFIVNYENGARK